MNVRIILARTVCAVLVAKLAHANDGPLVNTKAYRIQEVSEEYKQYTGRAPTPDQVRESLKITVLDEAARYGELLAAMQLTELGARPDDSVLEILEKQATESSKSRVRARAILALIAFNPEKGRALGKAALALPSFELDAKMSLAKSLPKYGELWGYPMIKEALDQKTTHFDIHARDLVLAFTPYDGKPWNERGDKINLAPFRAELAKR